MNREVLPHVGVDEEQRLNIFEEEKYVHLEYSGYVIRKRDHQESVELHVSGSKLPLEGQEPVRNLPRTPLYDN